jgi:hypothetical protein
VFDLGLVFRCFSGDCCKRRSYGSVMRQASDAGDGGPIKQTEVLEAKEWHFHPLQFNTIYYCVSFQLSFLDSITYRFVEVCPTEST